MDTEPREGDGGGAGLLPPPRSSDPLTHTLPHLCWGLSHSCSSFFLFFKMHLRLLTFSVSRLWLYFIFKYLFTYVGFRTGLSCSPWRL